MFEVWFHCSYLRRGANLDAGAVDGVFFVFIAVVVVVVSGGAAGGEAIEDEASYRSLGFFQEHDAAQDGFARGFAGPDDEDGFVDMGGDNEGIADGIHRGAVDNDAVESFQKVIEEGGKVGGGEEFGGIGRAATGCDEGEIFDSGLVDNGFQGGISAKVVCEAGGRFLAVEQGFVEAGTAQVGVDEKRFEILLGEDDGSVDGGVCFPLLGYCADEENDAALVLGPEHGEGGPEGAVGLGQ